MTEKYKHTFKGRRLPRGIFIDKDGYCSVRIFPNGQKFIKYIGPVSHPGVLDDAISKLYDYRQQIRTGKFGIEERAQRATIEQAIEIFWNLHASKARGRGPKTFDLILRHLKEFFAGRYIDSIVPMDVQRYRAKRLEKIELSTFNRERTVLVTLFNKLREWREEKAIKNIRLPEINPASKVKRENERIYARRRVLSPEEFDKFMQLADLNIRRNVVGAIHTLLRLEDLETLTKDNVNESTNQLEGVQGKTGKPYAVPINAVTRQLIDTATGHRIFDFTNFRKEFDATRKMAMETGGVKHFQFRDLRRTGARMMLKKGADIATVSAYLGHASIAMTQIYVPPSQSDKQVAAELLGTTYNADLTDNCRKDCRNDQTQDLKAPSENAKK